MNYMEIIYSDNYCIITPLSPRLGERECSRLFTEIEINSMFKTGLDLSYVKDCKIDFFNQIRNYKNLSL